MKYLKYILFCILLLNGINSIGQITGPNLVQNPSFEEYYSCPISTGELYKCKHWWGYSTDYYNSCSLSMGVPYGNNRFQYANTGDAYAGFIPYSAIWGYGSYRESIKALLSDSLKKDIRYCSSMYINVANDSYQNYFLLFKDSIDFLFTNYPFPDSLLLSFNYNPQITKSISLVDSTNWLKIKGSFISNGGEKYLTIGKFSDSIYYPYGQSIGMYLYVDDVSVCECSFNINLGADATLCLEEKLLLRANIPNAVYTWQDSSHAVTYEVKQPGTYWLRAYFPDYNITNTDTIVINYQDCNPATPALRIPNTFTPNGDGLNDVFEYFYAEYYEITTFIYNRWGELLFQSRNTDFWDGKYKEKTVATGVYVYRIEAIRKDTQQKKIHCGSVTVL